LSSANLLGNSIGVKQAQALLKIKEAKPGLTTLCGLSGDETALDLSGKKLGFGCAILLAPEMEANGSLASLNLANNELSGPSHARDMSGVTALAYALPKWYVAHAACVPLVKCFLPMPPTTAHSGPLASLDISNNGIGSEQGDWRVQHVEN
jgi:hypothetical protein